MSFVFQVLLPCTAAAAEPLFLGCRAALGKVLNLATEEDDCGLASSRETLEESDLVDLVEVIIGLSCVCEQEEAEEEGG